MNADRNPYLQRLDQLQAARKLWNESEWHLNLLRSDSGLATVPLTDEYLLQWSKNLNLTSRAC